MSDLDALLARVHSDEPGARDELVSALYVTLRRYFRGRGIRQKSEIDDVLRLFESDRVDPARLAALRTAREGKLKELGDVIQQAVVEAHDTLTPQQRLVVTDRIRAFRTSHE